MTTSPEIRFGANASRETVSDYSLKVLRSILQAAGVVSAEISSTARDAFNQARVMYNNLEAVGVTPQYKLYGRNGDLVIDVYAAQKKLKKTRDEVIEAMRQKIIEIGPAKVSHHCADPAVLCVVDIRPSSVPRKQWDAFRKAVRADRRVSKFLEPPLDPGFHIEIPQPKETA